MPSIHGLSWSPACAEMQCLWPLPDFQNWMLLSVFTLSSWSLSTACVSLQTFCVPYFLLSKTVVFPAHEYLCSGVGQQAGVLLQSSDARVLAVVSGVGSSVLWCWETPPTDPMNMHSLETEILGSLSRMFLRCWETLLTDPITVHCTLLLWLKFWIWPPPCSGGWQRTLCWVSSVGKHALSIVISFV